MWQKWESMATRAAYAETGTARFAASPLNQLNSFLSALLLRDSTDTLQAKKGNLSVLEELQVSYLWTEEDI